MFMDYMLNHPATFGKLYKGGVWVGHSSTKINIIVTAGDTSKVGDSTGTGYHHADYTFAKDRFKFVWNHKDFGSSAQKFLTYSTWRDIAAINDSLNVSKLPFDNLTMRDGSKVYRFYRNGNSTEAATPHNLPIWFNQTWGRKIADSSYISIIITHLACAGGLNQTDRDSIEMVHDSSAVWKIWLPSTKALLNQQAASAFGQFTVDRPASSKRRINITHLTDWSWGAHVPDREELYFLTFICYAPESLIITLNASDTLTDSVMTDQQDVATTYGTANANTAMSWVSMYNRTAGRLVVIYTPAAGAPSGKRNRTAVIERLLSLENYK